MHFCSLLYEATCIFNGTQPRARTCTQDANSTSTSYDAGTTTRFREVRARKKKGPSTPMTHLPVSIRAFQGQKSTSFAILFLVPPGPVSVSTISRRARSCARARLLSFLCQKGRQRDPVPLLLIPKKYCARSRIYRDRLI